MRDIPREQVLRRLQAENPWWQPPHQVGPSYRDWKHRAYFDLLFPLIAATKVNRAVVLLGPRRVGKTVMMHHAVQRLLDQGIRPTRLCYISVDHPIYNGCGLEDLLGYFSDAIGGLLAEERAYVFFDEIQYLKGWEVHLKRLVDDHPQHRFIASGSAAAALRLKSHESGAGRFTDFLLPPLTFHEYLELRGAASLVAVSDPGGVRATDLTALNDAFVHYLNFGGYPEVVLSEEIQRDPGRFVKGDIIDKVLLRDLPSLYGIQDIQELNSLFTALAYNTAGEVSLDELSKRSGVAKNTIKRYVEYLEAAFLIKTVHRVDRDARRFQRATAFKVYLTNPSIRSALFNPVDANDEALPSLAETAIYSQWFHSAEQPVYARWSRGEVDLVLTDPIGDVVGAVEVKWSDRAFDHPMEELKSLIDFCHTNRQTFAMVTTRTRSGERNVAGVRIEFIPSSLYCYTVGRNVVQKRAPIRP
jgi:uncharacterized protein